MAAESMTKDAVGDNQKESDALRDEVVRRMANTRPTSKSAPKAPLQTIGREKPKKALFR